MALKNLPKICPSCGKRLSVQAMHCNGCDTHIEGDYNLVSEAEVRALMEGDGSGRVQRKAAAP